MNSKVDFKRQANLLDIINMFVGVYFDKYIGFHFDEYHKWASDGINQRYVLFDSRDQSAISHVFTRLMKVNDYFREMKNQNLNYCREKSHYGFYLLLTERVFGLKNDEGVKLAQILILRENLLKLTNRYNDLTSKQVDLPQDPHMSGKHRSLFTYNPSSDDKDIYEYSVEGVIFNKPLNDYELEDDIVKITKSLNTKTIAKKIEQLDRLIEARCPHLNDVFRVEK